MDELVKKADVIDCLRIGKDESIEISRRGIKKYILGVCRKIEQLPTVQPEVEKKGKWIADVDRWGDVVTTVNGYICSECKVFNTDKDNYCPNCGAEMEESDG